jgi:hypothetical protein
MMLPNLRTFCTAEARRSKDPLLVLLALLAGLVPTGLAEAHPISLTQAFVFVTREKATVKLDCFAEDLFLFHNLVPNDRDFLEPDVIRRGIERHRAFLLERFTIRDVRGERLSGRLIRIEQPEMPAEGIRLADLMSHRVSFQVEYPFADPPEFLTFSQDLAGEKLAVPAEVQLNVKQESAAAPSQEVLYPGKPYTVRFQWDSPPLAPDASQEAWDQWYQRQKDETLGITSYSAVYSFLYLTDYEVRHEILVPLLSLEESVLIARADDLFLEIAEQDAAREQIAAYFLAGNPLEIDGVAVRPVVQRVDFYGLEFKDFAQQAQRRRVPMSSARVGVILSYSTKGTPNSVHLTWDRFNRFIWTVHMIVYAFDDTFRIALSRVGLENEYLWQNPGRPAPAPLTQVDVALPPRTRLSLPVVSIACAALWPGLMWLLRRRSAAPHSYVFGTALAAALAAGAWPVARWEIPSPFATAPNVSAEQAAAIFAVLHKNIYRAFDYREDNDIYDALANSADGPLLRDLYLQVRRGLEMQEQGGAVSRVRNVRIVSGQKEPPAAAATDPRSFAYRCRWTVDGTVEHWGHVHARTNEYEARFTVEPRADAWKITGLDVLNERRLKVETTVRGL